MENRVLDKSEHGEGLLLSKILDRARLRFSSARDRGSARTGRRPRKLYHRSSMNVTASTGRGAIFMAPYRI